MEPNRSILDGMAKQLLDRTLAAAGEPLIAALRDALVSLVVESMQLGMQIERERPTAESPLAPALRKDLVHEDSFGMWCAHSSSDGVAYALAGSRDECRDEMIHEREHADGEGYAAAIAAVDHALSHGDTFIVRCAVRVAWVNDGEEHQPTRAWLDTVPA